MPSLLLNCWRSIFNVFAKNQKWQLDLPNCWRCSYRTAGAGPHPSWLTAGAPRACGRPSGKRPPPPLSVEDGGRIRLATQSLLSWAAWANAFALSLSLSFSPVLRPPPYRRLVRSSSTPGPVRSVVGAAAAAIVVEEGRRTSDDLGLLKRTLKTSPAHNGQALDGWGCGVA